MRWYTFPVTPVWVTLTADQWGIATVNPPPESSSSRPSSSSSSSQRPTYTTARAPVYVAQTAVEVLQRVKTRVNVNRMYAEALGKSGTGQRLGRVYVEVLGKISFAPTGVGYLGVEVLGKFRPGDMAVNRIFIETLGRVKAGLQLNKVNIEVLGKTTPELPVKRSLRCWLKSDTLPFPPNVMKVTEPRFVNMTEDDLELFGESEEEISTANQLKEGDALRQWTDSCPDGNHAFQDEPLLQPTVQTKGINGYPAAKFSSGQRLIVPTLFSRPYTIFVVGQMLGPQRERILAGHLNNWSLGWWGGTRRAGYFQGWVYGPTTVYADSGVYCYTAISQGSLASLYENGVFLAANSGGVQPPAGLSLGGGMGEYSDCLISEVLVYSRALGEADRTQVEEYLMNKFRIDKT
jgi:hypothetical protein